MKVNGLLMSVIATVSLAVLAPGQPQVTGALHDVDFMAKDSKVLMSTER